ncbi:MAG: polyprenyl synthetase family protein [Tannerella sp.]|jgi:octaprenyl-diphosphate synthase|nr:polyprenyl synthetase family protein [Tannerella sp.]
MIDLSQIIKPVLLEFEQFKKSLSEVIQTEIPLLEEALLHVLSSKGKHVRPLLLLLTAKATGEISPVSIDYSVLIEILHTTTLIHDDVVDDTKQRRGVPSLNAIFDNRVAVLTGDFLLAGVMLKAVDTGNLMTTHIVAQVCRELAEGELMQLDNAENHYLNEEKYFSVIHKKTATLISACAEIGAISAGAPAETVQQCRYFGEYLGYCFQIKDDIFDYYEDIEIGKPTGNDIREGKISLPLLYALQNSTEKERDRYIKIIRNQDFTNENVSALIAFAKQSGGIEYAERRLMEFRQKAIEIINSFPASEARAGLLLLADYFSERAY